MITEARHTSTDFNYPVRVQLLQRPDIDFAALEGGYPFGGGARGRKRRNRRNARRHRGAPNGFLVKPRLGTRGSIYDEIDALLMF